MVLLLFAALGFALDIGITATLSFTFEQTMTGISVHACAHCGADMIAPEWSAHLAEHCVRNVWSCAACGYQFKDTVCFATQETMDAAPIFASLLFV